MCLLKDFVERKLVNPRDVEIQTQITIRIRSRFLLDSLSHSLSVTVVSLRMTLILKYTFVSRYSRSYFDPRIPKVSLHIDENLQKVPRFHYLNRRHRFLIIS